MAESETKAKTNLDELFKHGAHFGFGKSRRHPSMTPLIFGSKNRSDIFDLEKTAESLEKALSFVADLASTGAVILFVGGKSEATKAVEGAAQNVNMPYVASRWIGGTLTNFSEIRKRVDTMLDLLSQKEKGELIKYTKKERLLIDRKIEKLQKMYGGVKSMTHLPKALFIVDPRYEETALREANTLKIPVIGLCSTDNNLKNIKYPIPANDSSRTSIEFFVNKIAEGYNKAKS